MFQNGLVNTHRWRTGLMNAGKWKLLWISCTKKFPVKQITFCSHQLQAQTSLMNRNPIDFAIVPSRYAGGWLIKLNSFIPVTILMLRMFKLLFINYSHEQFALDCRWLYVLLVELQPSATRRALKIRIQGEMYMKINTSKLTGLILSEAPAAIHDAPGRGPTAAERAIQYVHSMFIFH